jgi:O-antigen ligase
VAGVGVGAQPEASRAEGGRKSVEKNASHTTPLTVAAELGLIGVVAYLAFLAGAARLLLGTVRSQRGLGLGLSAAFLLLFVHSLFYSGFFEDPLTWGILGVAAAAVSEERAVAPAAKHDLTATSEGPSLAT